MICVFRPSPGSSSPPPDEEDWQKASSGQVMDVRTLMLSYVRLGSASPRLVT